MAPSFELDNVVIGLPALITAIVGGLVACAMMYKISLCPNALEDNGDPARKKMSDTIQKLNKAISLGAQAFLFKEYTYLFIVTCCLFVLVSAAVNWRTGIWYATII